MHGKPCTSHVHWRVTCLCLRRHSSTLISAEHSRHPPPLVVVAEKVLRVPDSNRPPHCRVDFFCYMPTGEVVRYHPHSLQPHSMPPRCKLFDAGLARSVGVGAALHLQPPRLVAYSGATQPGDLQPRTTDSEPNAFTRLEPAVWEPTVWEPTVWGPTVWRPAILNNGCWILQPIHLWAYNV